MMNLDATIKKCGFDKNEIHTATYGECMWFGTALQRILTARQVKSDLVLAACGMEHMAWAHVLVKQSEAYYDIRGRVDIRDVHKQYRTKIIRFITERTYFEDYLKWEGEDALLGKIQKWHDRLIGVFE